MVSPAQGRVRGCNPDRLRIAPRAVEFVRAFVRADEPVTSGKPDDIGAFNAKMIAPVIYRVYATR